MIRKTIILTSFLLLQLLSLKAQVGIAYINPNFQQINSKSFNAFANSYVATNGFALSSYDFSQTGTGFTIGGGIAASNSPIILGMEYSRAKSTAEFNFTNKAQRYLSLHSNLLNFKFMIPVGDFGENRFLGLIEFGAGLGRAVIKSEFQQGTTPINSTALDGKFTSFHGEVSGGFSLMYMFGPLGLKASCSYNMSLISSRLDDKDKEMDYDSLPQDFGAFILAPAAYTGEEVKDDFRYLKFGLGVVVILD
ncbi:MAG: hypothetical protein IM638_19245 [Bacteroidetes bacterium]|nr:hypothetical protein [Bacteroidota bacterium]